jgi:1-acyl-sn-glycerol-3-phosphate acyltransferase
MRGLVAVLRSILFYTAFYGGTAILTLCAVPVALTDKRGMPAMVRAWARFHRFCVTVLLGIRIELRGEFPLKSALVAMKHESFFDPLELPNLFPRPAIFAKAELMRIPVWGWLAKGNGVIPVQRDEGSRALRAMLAAARKYASEGNVLIIFPEGTRVPHGSAPKLRAGFAALYKALGLPVVPVAVDSGPLYHRRWKRGGTITISAGEPIPPGLPRQEIEARVHEAINALNH